MPTHKMDNDGAFDTQTTIENLTVDNIKDVPFLEMLKILGPFVLVEVPENLDDDDPTSKRKYDYLLARLSNVYAYLRVLWSAITYHRARMKHINADQAEEIQKKKEALFELGNAVKLKYEAVSRKITVALSDESDTPERPSYEARREQFAKPRATRSGWDSLK